LVAVSLARAKEGIVLQKPFVLSLSLSKAKLNPMKTQA
jgi:hypothetical protein